jgi:hypothetical protein
MEFSLAPSVIDFSVARFCEHWDARVNQTKVALIDFQRAAVKTDEADAAPATTTAFIPKPVDGLPRTADEDRASPTMVMLPEMAPLSVTLSSLLHGRQLRDQPVAKTDGTSAKSAGIPQNIAVGADATIPQYQRCMQRPSLPHSSAK